LADDFQRWYDGRKFGSPNRHGPFNGMNLVGLDPIGFYRAYGEKRVKQPLDYLLSLPKIAVVRGRATRVPDFVRRYPNLSSYDGKAKAPSIWEITFGPAGIPLRCDPAPSGVKLPAGQRYQVHSYQGPTDPCLKCRRLIISKKGGLAPTTQLTSYLDLLLGN
ncbi:MAG: hypothetical protein VB980_01855, partial [Opitutales bacterium]